MRISEADDGTSGADDGAPGSVVSPLHEETQIPEPPAPGKGGTRPSTHFLLLIGFPVTLLCSWWLLSVLEGLKSPIVRLSPPAGSAALGSAPGAENPTLPILGQIPHFELTDQNGKHFDSIQLRGQVWVAAFIFTNCASSCPMMTSKMTSMMNRMPDRSGVTFVSISVDPDRDTPEVLREYRDARARSGVDWVLLTGEQATIHELARNGFHLSAARNDVPGGEPFLHSQSFILVDQTGGIRGYYNGLDDTAVETLRADIGRLIP